MRRVLIGTAGVVAALLVLAFALTYPSIHRLAHVGTGYVAMQMCGCVDIAERPYDACLLDLLPAMDRIRSESVAEDGLRGIRAWIPLYAERTAWHHPPDGCTLE